MASSAINRPFSRFDAAVKSKFLWLGGPGLQREAFLDQARSLHLEHVSSAGLGPREISRRPGAGDTALALLRRWFFARKPDAGFVLTDFPATLLQAQVLDEWLEARGETLDGVFAGSEAPAPVVEHYRIFGLLADGSSVPA